MASITDKNTLKSWFQRGLKPLASQFAAWMDSYWHKSETIPTGNIEDLDIILNSKAESETVDNWVKLVNQHVADEQEHKTAEEQNKLNHLAANPDGTYATKEELDPVILRCTYTTNENGDKHYSIEDTQTEIIADYIVNDKRNPVLLECVNAADGASTFRVCTQIRRISGANRSTMFVFPYLRQSADGIYNYTIEVDAIEIVGMQAWSTNISANNQEIVSSEYEAARYIPESSFDMNTFTLSGGIQCQISEEIVGNNIPEGFTNFHGYVLSNANRAGRYRNTCTQVVTDDVLNKTMMRTSYIIPEESLRLQWTEWKEIGPSLFQPTCVLRYTFAMGSNTGSINEEDVKAYIKAIANGMEPTNVLFFKDSTIKIKITSVYFAESNGTYSLLLYGSSNSAYKTIDNGRTALGQGSNSDTLNAGVVTAILVGTTESITQNMVYYDEVRVNTADYLKLSNIHVVSEYPSDLSAYPDGAIFIKQA